MNRKTHQWIRTYPKRIVLCKMGWIVNNYNPVMFMPLRPIYAPTSIIFDGLFFI